MTALKANKLTNIWFFVSVICVITMLVFSSISLFVDKKLINILLYVVLAGLMFSLIFGAKNNEKLFKMACYCIVISCIVYIGYFILKSTGVFDNITSLDAIKQMIKSTGAGGLFTYLGIMILQVVVLPIPSSITILAGTMIYGPTLSFLIGTLGILLGSLCAFSLGRFFGKKIIYSLFDKSNVDKYSSLLGDKGGGVLFLIFLLPFFPDDMMCMVAGMTSMTYKKFIGITLCARAMGVASLSYFGSGKVIPFHGIGLVIWGAVGVITLFCVVLVAKNRKKLSQKFFGH